ncbi:MAG: hypothetical protein V1770_06730 [bacterium]
MTKKIFIFFVVLLLFFGCAGRQKQNLAGMYNAATDANQIDSQKILIPAPAKAEPHYANAFRNTFSEDVISDLQRSWICVKKLSDCSITGVISGDFNAPASEVFKAIVENSKCGSIDCDFEYSDGNCYTIGPFDSPKFLRIESLGIYDDAKTFLQVIPDEIKKHLRVRDTHTILLTAPKSKLPELKTLFQNYNERPRKIAIEVTVEAITYEDLQNFGINVSSLQGLWEWAEGKTSSFEGTTSLLRASLPGKLQMLMQSNKTHLLKRLSVMAEHGRESSLSIATDQHFRMEGERYDRIDKVGSKDAISFSPYLLNAGEVLISGNTQIGEMGTKSTVDNLPQVIQRAISIKDGLVIEKGKKTLIEITHTSISSDSKEGTPLLGKIFPYFFSSKSKNYEEALLLIFITCYF